MGDSLQHRSRFVQYLFFVRRERTAGERTSESMSKVAEGKEDCEKLMNAVLPFAQKMLAEHREFYPFGGYMKPTGEIAHVGVQDADTDYPKSKDLLNLLHQSHSAMARAGECRATVIVFDVRIDLPGTNQKSDAIQVCLEHADGYSAEVFFPYKIAEDGRVAHGAMFAQEGKHEIFGKS
jgi:hypothetical protein